MSTSTSHKHGWWALITAALTSLLLTLAFAPAASAAGSTILESNTAVSNTAVSNTAGPAITTAPYCGITWGSVAKVGVGAAYPGTVENIRAGRHDCFDRLVIDLGTGSNVGYDVRYVGQVVQDGSGLPVALRGGAYLQVLVQANAYDGGGSTYAPAIWAEAVAVGSFSTFRQVAWAGSFEGQSTVGLGVRARLPFRVLLLDGPGSGGRLVIDVAHRW